MIVEKVDKVVSLPFSIAKFRSSTIGANSNGDGQSEVWVCLVIAFEQFALPFR